MSIRTSLACFWLAPARSFRRRRGPSQKFGELRMGPLGYCKPFEIPQNRKELLEKLEKKGLVLEILWHKLCRLGARS